MKVKEMVAELLKLDPNEEVYMFFKTVDRKCSFTSDVTTVANGAIYDEYGNLIPGVLILKEE
jgi:hypothetical protein